jgi:hypothetical protein
MHNIEVLLELTSPSLPSHTHGKPLDRILMLLTAAANTKPSYM